MKLDRDCIRDFLLALESLGPGQRLTHSNYQSIPLLASYEQETIIYTAEKLKEAGFINVQIVPVLCPFLQPVLHGTAISSLTISEMMEYGKKLNPLHQKSQVFP